MKSAFMSATPETTLKASYSDLADLYTLTSNKRYGVVAYHQFAIYDIPKHTILYGPPPFEVTEGYSVITNKSKEQLLDPTRILAPMSLIAGYSPPANMKNAVVNFKYNVVAPMANSLHVTKSIIKPPPTWTDIVQASGRTNRAFA